MGLWLYYRVAGTVTKYDILATISTPKIMVSFSLDVYIHCWEVGGRTHSQHQLTRINLIKSS